MAARRIQIRLTGPRSNEPIGRRSEDCGRGHRRAVPFGDGTDCARQSHVLSRRICTGSLAEASDQRPKSLYLSELVPHLTAIRLSFLVEQCGFPKGR